LCISKPISDEYLDKEHYHYNLGKLMRIVSLFTCFISKLKKLRIMKEVKVPNLIDVSESH
jgi:hypothetical protein